MATDCADAGQQGMIFPDEPIANWKESDFNRLLLWGVENEASDITVLPSNPVWMRLHGAWQTVSMRSVSKHDIEMLLERTTRMKTVAAQVEAGMDFDFGYSIKTSNISSTRFRVNVTACRDRQDIGHAVTFRAIPSIPPRLEELDVEPEILSAAFPDNGLVLVTGVMGSGKSTLLSSMLRWVRENQPRNVLTYEAPIEFDLTELENVKGPITQSEIPTHLSSFAIAPRNSARRAADVILVGESRDQETLRGMIEAAEIGVAAYSTVHTRSVAETPTRIINVFPQNAQQQVASTLISSLRLIIQQRLLPRVGGGRVAIKEFLVFTPQVRKLLFNVDISQLVPTLQDLVEQSGQTLYADAKQKFEAGLIVKDELEKIYFEREFGGGEKGGTDDVV